MDKLKRKAQMARLSNQPMKMPKQTRQANKPEDQKSEEKEQDNAE